MSHPNKKGGGFERKTAKRLSLWISHGERDDLLWRTAMSGGRATLQGKKGLRSKAQEGDLGAIDPLGNRFTRKFMVECKFYKDLDIDAFVLTGRGNLAKFWRKHMRQAMAVEKSPILIARQNGKPTMMIFADGIAAPPVPHRVIEPLAEIFRASALVYAFDEFMKIDYPWDDD